MSRTNARSRNPPNPAKCARATSFRSFCSSLFPAAPCVDCVEQSATHRDRRSFLQSHILPPARTEVAAPAEHSDSDVRRIAQRIRGATRRPPHCLVNSISINLPVTPNASTQAASLDSRVVPHFLCTDLTPRSPARSGSSVPPPFPRPLPRARSPACRAPAGPRRRMTSSASRSP